MTGEQKTMCRACSGAGETELRTFAAGASPYDQRITCPRCSGEGWLVRIEDRWYPDREPVDRSAA